MGIVSTDLESESRPTRERTFSRSLHGELTGTAWQFLAIFFCVLVGVAMIVNTQLEGEAWWFWYARLLHSGSKLYADLHLALQPLMVLEMDAWTQMFGIKTVVTEIPALLHVLAFCGAILLILRESDWPDWQKAVTLAGAFLISVECSAYRFDDFHVVADTLTYYSVALLLSLARADRAHRQLGLAAGLGVLSGLAITTRLNDGGALLVAAGLCLVVLARSKKLVSAALFVVVAALTVAFIVKLTGDSLSDYVSNSAIRAAGAKGGAGNVLSAPFRILHSTFHELRGKRWLFLWILGILAASIWVQNRWRNQFRYLVALQLGMAGLAYFCSSWLHRVELREGAFFSFVTCAAILVTYLLVPIMVMGYFAAKLGNKRKWNRQNILFLVPLAALASAATSTGATVTQVFWSPIALLFLLIAVVQPLRSQASWVNASVVTIVALLGVSALADKVHHPYAWLHFQSDPMFQHRQWYRHPVYGPMYLESDLLHFIVPICHNIRAEDPEPEVLSLPWAYPNYFCDVPPWHGYVQTFFDTSTRSTIEQLMRELNTTPPRWIVYQRDMDDLSGIERALNGSRPLPHRGLDHLIVHKIETGQWQVVQESKYLFRGRIDADDGWYLIRTRP